MKLQRYLLACIVLVIALSVLAMPVSAQWKVVPQDGIVLLGEEGLDISNTVGANTTYLGWWSGTDYSTPPTLQIALAGYQLGNFNIDDGAGSPFITSADKGPWWQLNTSGETNPSQRAFSVVTPKSTLKIKNLDYNTDVTDGTALIGDVLDFELNPSTLHHIFLNRLDPGVNFNAKIVVKSPGGVTYSTLWTPSLTAKSLINLPVSSSPWYWSSGNGVAPVPAQAWKTDYVDASSNPVYSAGEYKVTIECNQNNLGFVGTTKTVTLEEEQPVLTVSPGSVIRGNKFFTTIQGIPNATYIIWMVGCDSCPGACCSGPMSGDCCDQPPTIVLGQEGVSFESLRCHNISCDCDQHPCGDGYPDQGPDYSCFGCTLVEWCGCLCTENLRDILPPETETERYFALVTLDEHGERTIEWQTSTCTAPGSYLIHTNRWEPEDICELDLTRPFAEACVNVQKGVVTINTDVCGQITSATYLGETVKVFGTNTDSKVTYLFITGPCQDCAGENMTVTNVVKNWDATTFTKVPVKADGTWEYYWYTRELSIDLGQYTIYASSMPNDAPALEGIACNDCEPPGLACAAWAKKPFTFLEPTITAGIHPVVVQIECCEPTSITVAGHASGLRGTAVGKTYNTVPLGIWVFGADKVAGQKYIFETFYVDCATGEFSVDLKNYLNTLALEPGTYTVVVQHPMYNQRLDIIPETKIFEQSGWYYWWMMCTTYSYLEEEIWYPDANRKFVVTATPVRWSKLFIIEGTTRLAGTQALNALLIGFENPNIDDKVVTLNFKVESNTALKADFSGMPTSGEAPLTVQFTDISTGAPTSWYWNFGDGVFSTEMNPVHTYLNPGTYTVGLTVSNTQGTSSITKNHYIAVSGVGPTPTPTQTPVPGSDLISLKNGWNFVSTPKTLADAMNTAGVVFGSVDTAGRSIYLYNAEIGLWESMTASSIVRPLDGIWIYSNGAMDVPLTFKSGGAATPPTKNVYAGWNAIGFSDVVSKTAKSTLITVDDNPRKTWSMVIGWNAVSQGYDSAITNVDPDNTAHMQPTKGYWLFMNGDQSYYPWVLASLSS
ncbi:MAG TPA: DUF3821 domain-containing protein [Methanoregulaceae archaeon]|jgi:hypothetical protein|nr:DUF3821 domain-containing protein [Methanoregulaceae archaeon]